MEQIRGKFFLLNDKILPASQFVPEVIEYGTTIYELIKIVNCVPIFYDEYMERMNQSLKAIGREFWLTSEQLKERIKYLIELNCVRQTDHLRLVISFDNLFYPEQDKLFLAYLVQMHLPTPEQYENGVKTLTLNAIRQNPNVKVYLPDLRRKAEQLIAKNNIYEVILLDDQNHITEGSRSNIFFIKNNTLYTASLHKVLPGITRKKVIQLAKKHNIDVQETNIHYSELTHFQAAFLTATSRKIVPIRTIDNFVFDPKNQLLRQLKNWLDQEIKNYAVEHYQQWQCSGC